MWRKELQNRIKKMMTVLTTLEQVTRIMNLIAPFKIWYTLTIDNEEAGNSRATIFVEYCVVHPADLVEETDSDYCDKMIHKMHVDWLDDTIESFMSKLREMDLYLRFCNLLVHQDNYFGFSAKEKVEFVEMNLKRIREEKNNYIPF